MKSHSAMGGSSYFCIFFLLFASFSLLLRHISKKASFMRLLNVSKKNPELEQLMEAERPRLLQYACYRLGNRDDAEDALQDVFISLHQRLRESGRDVYNLTSYLYRSLANLCVSRQRRSEHVSFVTLDGQVELSDSVQEDFEQEFRRISRLLAKIPEEQAEVIRLRFYGDKSFREIAEILDLPITTVKSRFQYGIDKIRREVRSSVAKYNP